MVYTVTKLSFPVNKSEDSGKAFFEVMNMFPNLYREGKPAKRIIGLIRSKGEVVATTIWEVTGDFVEASIEISKVYLELVKRIEGSSYSSYSCMSVMESLPV
ncbi:MAG: hypothetical protein ACW990_18355, partial [Promethearchaeota archaeon]